MRCSFCATGKGGFARNLKAHEIVDQVMTVQEEFKRRVNNVGRPSCKTAEALLYVSVTGCKVHWLDAEERVRSKPHQQKEIGVLAPTLNLTQHR